MEDLALAPSLVPLPKGELAVDFRVDMLGLPADVELPCLGEPCFGLALAVGTEECFGLLV